VRRPAAARGRRPPRGPALSDAPVLVVFGGLPGTGKTTIAREVAARLRAAYVRIDAIEAALWRGGIPREQPTGIATYVAANAVADGCVRVGVDVVVDAVNPVEAAREGWRELARRTGVSLRVVEVVCADEDEHRRRVESRVSDLEGLAPPTWSDVESRIVDPWTEPRLTLDTSAEPVDASVERVLAYVAALTR